MFQIENHGYRPLPDGLYIGTSDIHGQGVFTTVDITAGEVLGETHYELGTKKSGRLLRSPLGGFLNHSDNANCEIVVVEKVWFLLTSRDISSGEELTVNYEKCYELNPFQLEPVLG